MTAYPGDMQWLSTVRSAFPGTDFGTRMLAEAANGQPSLFRLFEDIAQYVVSLRGTHSHETTTNGKRRKLDNSGSSQTPRPIQESNGIVEAGTTNPIVAYECSDVSFLAPMRRKMKLQIVADAGGQQRNDLRLINPTTNQPEHVLAADQIGDVFCLPVPEKQQRQWNFIIFPNAAAIAPSAGLAEQIVFTMSELPPTGAHSFAYTPNENDTYVTLTELELGRVLKPYGKRVITPDVSEFASAIPQAHRKGERAYHVKAHRGSKEGFLFFLSNGIVFGFKKPLGFYPFASIESISYTSVLQRTFNLVIAATESDEQEAKEIEFSMLDQADFAGIDEYVRKHGLNDASMAAQRRAKAYNVNKDKTTEANGESGLGEDDQQSELQKAEQQLQDEEDEGEEDYEASGSESEGDGEYSSDEEDEDIDETHEDEAQEDD